MVTPQKERKDAQRIIRLLMSTPGSSKRGVTDIGDVASIEDLNGKNLDVMTRIILAQAKDAIKGDRAAAEFLFKYGAFEPPKEQSVTVDMPTLVDDIGLFAPEKPAEDKPKVDPRTGIIAGAVLYNDPDESVN